MPALVARLSGLGFDTTEKCRCRRFHPHTSSCPGRPKAETRASMPPSRRVKPWMAVLVTRLSGLGFDTTEKCRCRRSHPHTSSCPGRPKAETRASMPPSRRVKPWMAVTSPRVQSAWHHAMDWEPGGKHGHDECTECFHGTFTTHFTQPDIGATSAGMTNHGL